jgi:tetratricopeptide (TPR) repeat protein
VRLRRLTWHVINDEQLRLPDPPADLAARLARGAAIAWSAPVQMTTYEPDAPDRYPMFLDRRVYQGSSGRVYPMPFTDRIASAGTPRSWEAVHLENSWLRVMVLPELGGRIHVGYDKTAGYDFFYRNSVIKPALVGLAGPWISGGVEFNWPQHHRPATFLPVQYSIEENDDGSVTVWCSDHDPFTRMKGMHGVRLYPDRSVIELEVRLHNRTSHPQTFLWWANVAARVHDDYQSVFPTDVSWVADHARRAITAFPSADRPYYGVDYPAKAAGGGDRIDWYKNIPVPTSYMVTDTKDDFFGGYDHAAGAGFVHVADRHIAPGKKQWTWGDDAFGHAWDRLLTDSDGAYVELMAGVYTDNQPDFAWLEPGETKTFSQYWYPVAGTGAVHQANRDAAVRLEVDANGRATARVAVTSPMPGARVEIRYGDSVARGWDADLAPGAAVAFEVAIPGTDVDPTLLTLTVVHAGRRVIEWTPRSDAVPPEPWVATEPPAPKDVTTVEELYLTGMHLEQYRHPTRSALPYWREALARDPSDARTNLALARHLLRRAEYTKAEHHARTAIERLTVRNGNPRDGEAHYVLGIVLGRLNRCEDAVNALAKAAWDTRWIGAASVELARLYSREGDDARAREAVAAALRANSEDGRALALQLILQRRAGIDVGPAVRARLEIDPLDQTLLALVGRHPGDARTLLDVALDLAAAGEADAAITALDAAISRGGGPEGNPEPTLHYHRAALLDRAGRHEEAFNARRRAQTVDSTLCFPSGLDDHDVLRLALVADPADVRAAALLGMLLFDGGRSADALALWSGAIELGATDPVLLRNAAIALWTTAADGSAARALYDRALSVRIDARLLYERDQLLLRLGTLPGERLELLEAHLPFVLSRDDSAVVFCGLLTKAGRHNEALSILTERVFAPWEGGEGMTLAAWDAALVAASESAIAEGDFATGAELLRRAFTPPRSLGEARHPLADTTPLLTRLALACDAAGLPAEAAEARLAMVLRPEQAPVVSDEGVTDYFATSLPELLLFGPAPGLRGTNTVEMSSPVERNPIPEGK